MSDPIIHIVDICKEYRLGQIGGTTLQHELQSWWAARTGREDPNRPLGWQKRDGRFLALDHISLDIQKGECLGVIGRNGAGKSTLLKLLSGITAPTSGDINLYGRVSSLLEVGAGFHREMTGRENIYLNGAILGMTRKEIDAKMDAIIEFSEIGPFIDTPVKRYSSGMYVKLAFSVAVHLDSEILIMDEVLAVGDVIFQRKCLEKLRNEAADGHRTVIYVSHNMDTVRQLCSRCALLERGKLVFLGSTEEAISRYVENSRDEDLCKDFSTLSRRSIKWKETAQLLYAEYLDHAGTEYCSTETMRFRLKWQNRCTETKICLRIEIWTLDDVPKASYILYDLPMDSLQEEVIYDISLDLHELIPDEYKMKYTLFLTGAGGSSTNADSVTGLFFRLLPPGDTRLTWDPSHWGHICLDGAAAQRVI